MREEGKGEMEARWWGRWGVREEEGEGEGEREGQGQGEGHGGA